MSFLGSRSIVFLGTPEPAARVLRALLDAGLTVESVVTRPDVRRGRGGATSPSPVKSVAVASAIPVHHDVEYLAERAPGSSLGVVVAYGRIIPRRVLDVVPMVNVHFSLLPRWRGAAPVERAILEGDEVTGVCLMDVVAELDAGGVYARREVSVGDDDTDGLTAKMADIGASMMVDLLSGPSVVAVPQRGEASYAAKISPADAVIDWNDDAATIVRRVRAVRAHTTVGGRRLIVHAARVAGQLDGPDRDPRPGSCGSDAVVACGSGAVELLRVQPEGKGELDAWDWRRGRREETLFLGG